MSALIWPAPGVYRGIPFETYRALPACNATALKTIHDDCEEQLAVDLGLLDPLAEDEETGEEAPEKDSRRLGHALHGEVLEGRLPILCPLDDSGKRLRRQGAANKAVWARAEIAAAAADTVLVSPAERRWLDAIPAAIARVPAARTLLDQTPAEDRELTILWEEDGILCKARLDGLVREWRLPWDLKSTRDARPNAFGRQAAGLNYHIQAAWYLRGCAAIGIEADEFAFLAVRNILPSRCAVYRVPESVLAQGREDVAAAFERYRQAIETGIWPGYGTEIQDLQWPRWAFKKQEANIDEW